MNKIVDGVELLRMIRDGNIKHNDEIRFGGKIYTFNEDDNDFYLKGEPEYEANSILKNYTIDCMLSFKFELLSFEEEEKQEDDEKIDIQAIKELDEELYGGKHFLDERIVRINELVKAVKQLDKN